KKTPFARGPAFCRRGQFLLWRHRSNPSPHRLTQGDNVLLLGQRFPGSRLRATSERNPRSNTPPANDRPRSESTPRQRLLARNSQGQSFRRETERARLCNQPIISKLQKNLARKERWCSVLPSPAHPDPFRQVTQPKSPWPDRLRQSNRFPMTRDLTGRKWSPEKVPTLDP